MDHSFSRGVDFSTRASGDSRKKNKSNPVQIGAKSVLHLPSASHSGTLGLKRQIRSCRLIMRNETRIITLRLRIRRYDQLEQKHERRDVRESKQA